MIDESMFAELLAEVAEEIPVPADGADRVVHALTAASRPARSTRTALTTRSRLLKPLMVAAAVVVIALVSVPLLHGGSNTNGVAVVAPSASALAPPSAQSRHLASAAPSNDGAGVVGTPPSPSDGSTASAPSGPVDGAKIVETGTLDLQVPHATLRVAVNRVTAVPVGLGGYVADSTTTYGGTDPNAQVTLRVPVNSFHTAIDQLKALPGVRVLGDSENGVDVTAQYTNLQAQLSAATDERDQLLGVLSRAESISDILAVRAQETAAQTEVDQLQGRINVLNDQATFSSLTVSLSEKPVRNPKLAVHHAATRTGLAKSWSDARQGFANAVEWLIARSGGALIILLAALAFVFGIRYLYPIVRRGLV